MAKVSSGRYPAQIQIPITGAGSIIVDGALIMPGVTQATNLGLGILATGASAQAIGILRGATVIANDSVQAGTTWTYATVDLIGALDIVEWEYSQASADILAVTSVSGTTVTITLLENGMDTSWLYAVSGTGAGLLAFCTAATGGTATTKTATGWDSTTKVIKILRVFHRLAVMNSAGTKLKTQAAAGSLTVDILENYIYAPGVGITKQLLDPTKHDNLMLVPSGSSLLPTFSTRLVHRSMIGQ